MRVSPLRALAGAGLAVGGVVLGIGALLSVTGEPEGSPALAEQPMAVAAPSTAPAPGPPTPELPMPVESAPPPPEPTTPVATPAPTTPVPARAVAPRRAAVAAPAPRPVRPPVTVLNNSTRTGLADRAAARFSRNGWPVGLVGNFRGQLRATTVYYEPGQQAAARRFASTFRGIDRVLPRAANIPGPRGMVVVLTRGFPA